ncbi:hypothetical protein TWF225_003680 [Orbilia oligospora]|nr:hypothetical protein TWF225_003680 [Orbilia oligospora]KAF3195274.1 hypothetical protein TWF225_003680 [Orbilia oligospora]KAF3267587.1 hypothetical protein TWF128_009116 [Orbilia oligospora]KAF3267588.1 hypothetical protein TWF128_009116 [Orbilia oligospora]KAF3269203.1 hypothetical protein TWF217_009297 [Orbilia oligospora]
MDQIQDLKTPSALQNLISETQASPDSPIVFIQFYNGPSSIQWAASTLYQNQQILQHFFKEISSGSLIFARIDGSILPSAGGNGNSQIRLDTNYEVSYGIFWQGKQQVYEVNALGKGAEGVVKREVEALLKMRGEMMDVERTRAGKRGVVIGGLLDNKRRWSAFAKPAVGPGLEVLKRRAHRSRGNNQI